MTKDITTSPTKESLEKLKLFSKLNIWLAIILSVLAIITISSLSGGKGYGAHILLIIASPLVIILPYYFFASYLIKNALQNENGASKGYLWFLRILVTMPWVFIIIALVVINS
ncbi:MAG: hypothetical protein L3J51_12095 [Cocleimonas sp.]|nr:hypothetical protein [Cocleimonas sp.]